MKKIISLPILCFVLLFTNTVFAGVIETDSTPTVVEVQQLVNDATDGDTIKFMGEATWTSTVTVDKNITINGNGYTLTASGILSYGFFRITGFTANSLVRITGFIFNLANWTTGCAVMVNNMSAGVDGGYIRIDHNTFHKGSYQLIFHHMKGLIDSNYFYNGVLAIATEAGSVENEMASWANLSAGTIDAIFIEDNHFIANASYTLAYSQEQIGGSNAGKIVIRYNSFNGLETGESSGDSKYLPIHFHGNAAQGDKPGYWERNTGTPRSPSVIEIYSNTMDAVRYDMATIVLRGGAGLIYNNTSSRTGPTATSFVYLWEEEYESDDWTANLRTAWPAEDQVHNTFIWNNTLNGSAVTISNISASPPCSAYPASCTAGLQEDRDFFLHVPCGASDSCTHGKETFSNLNGYTDGNGASNSHPGDGTVYTAHGTMQFTDTGDNAYYGYTPYTYPHPLRGGNRLSGGVVAGGTF